LARLAMLLMPGLALLLLGAHFFRAGSAPLAGLCAALVTLLFVRAPWAARTVQVALAIGTLEWLRAAWVLATARAAVDQPYARLLVILATVAMLTAVAAWVVGRRPLGQHFRMDHPGGR
jgi:hypothetical protein